MSFDCNCSFSEAFFILFFQTYPSEKENTGIHMFPFVLLTWQTISHLDCADSRYYSVCHLLYCVVVCFQHMFPRLPGKKYWYWRDDSGPPMFCPDQLTSSGRNISSILQVETTQTVFLKPVLSFFKTFLLVKLWHAASVGAEDGATATLLCLWTRVELNLEEGERQRCHPSVKRLANKSRQSRGRREGKERTRGEIWRAKG